MAVPIRGGHRLSYGMLERMCRSIKTLRPPAVDHPTEADIAAAARQYVRKVSGYRVPSKANAAAFDRAVDSVAHATSELLATLVQRT